MAKIEGVCRQVCETTEFVAIVTSGDDGPHVVGNWGAYMRKLGITEDRIVFPAGRYFKTEENLRKDNRVQLMVASKAVQGTRSPGQGCVISGTAEIVTSGEVFDAVKANPPMPSAPATTTPPMMAFLRGVYMLCPPERLWMFRRSCRQRPRRLASGGHQDGSGSCRGRGSHR